MQLYSREKTKELLYSHFRDLFPGKFLIRSFDGFGLLSVVARFVVRVGVIALLRLSCLTKYIIRLH